MVNDKNISRIRNGVQIDGRTFTINSVAVNVILKDENSNVLMATGTTVPTADSVGFAKGCLFIKTNAADGTKGLYENQGTTLLSDFNIIGSISDDPNIVAESLKIHRHLTAEDYNTQLRSESIKTTGTHWGIDSETHLNADGAASIRGVQGVAKLSAGFTSSGGTLIGLYGQARADGTFNGAGGFLAGIYGLIEASEAIVASHVCSAWFDSHQANAVTGSHQLVYMTNNGAAQMDQAFYIYGGDKITALMELDTVSGMVADTAETGGTSKKIKITIDGVVHYLNAYTG